MAQFPKPPDLDEQGNPLQSTTMPGQPPDLDDNGVPIKPTEDKPNIFLNSLKKGFTEGLPAIDLIGPNSLLSKLGSEPDVNTTQQIPMPWGPVNVNANLPRIARAAMYPAGVIEQYWNKLRGMATPQNVGMGALSTIPGAAPIVGGVFAADMGRQIPNQIRDVYNVTKEKGLDSLSSPEFYEKFGDLGLNALMTGSILSYTGKGIAESRFPSPERISPVKVTSEFDPEQLAFDFNKIPPPSTIPTEARTAPINTEQLRLPFETIPKPEPTPGTTIYTPSPEDMTPRPTSDMSRVWDLLAGREQRPFPNEPAPITEEGLVHPGVTAISNSLRATPEETQAAIERVFAAKAENDAKTAALTIPPPEPSFPSSETSREMLDRGEIPPFGTPDDPYLEREGLPPTTQPVTDYTKLTNDQLYRKIQELDDRMRQHQANDTTFTPDEMLEHQRVMDEVRNRTKLDEPQPRDFLSTRGELTGDVAPPVPALATVGDTVIGRESTTPNMFNQVPTEPVKYDTPLGYDSRRVLAIWRNKMQKDGKPILPPDAKNMSSEEILHWQKMEAAKEFAESKAAREAGKPPVQTPSRTLTYIVKKERVDPEFIKKAQGQGYKFIGLNEEGDYKFAKGQETKPTINDLIEEEGSKAEVAGRVMMDVKDRKAMINIASQSFQGDVPHLGAKELIQNAIDAATQHIKGKGRVDIKVDEGGKTITVSDNGAGLDLDLLKNEFLDLTGSGKRGKGLKTIGEMGVGKIAYLLKGAGIEVTSVTVEPKTIPIRGENGVIVGQEPNPLAGQRLKRQFTLTPNDVIEGIDPFIFEGTPVPSGKPTGTTINFKTLPGQEYYNLGYYLENLGKHSTSSIPIEITNVGKKYNYTTYQYEPVVSKTNVSANKIRVGDPVGNFSTEGADYNVSKPSDVNMIETDRIELVIVNRGMYMGTQTLQVGEFGKKYRLPDRLIIDVDPKVTATEKTYPLTAPTRETFEWRALTDVKNFIKKEIVEGSEKQRRVELEKIFREMVPKPGQNHILIDSKGRYTPEELEPLIKSKELTHISNTLKVMLSEFKIASETHGDIMSVGFLLDEGVYGVNVRNPNNHGEFSILLNPITILGDVKSVDEAGSAFVHVAIHELTHMKVRQEGADFTSTLASNYFKIGLDLQVKFKNQFAKNVMGENATGTISPALQNVLSESKKIIGREGTKTNTLITEEGSKSVRTGRQNEPVGTDRPDGKGIRDFQPGTRVILRADKATPTAMKSMLESGYKLIGQNDAGDFRYEKLPPSKTRTKTPILETEVGEHRPTTTVAKEQLGPQVDVKKSNPWIEAWNFRRGLMASGDLSAALRQGLPLIHKAAWRDAIKPMIESFGSESAFRDSQNEIASRPLFRQRVAPDGKLMPSFADDAGLKLTDLTDLSKREEVIMSNWAESGDFFKLGKLKNIGGEELATGYKNTVGRYVRGSNRAYVTFLNRLRADTFEGLIKDGKVFGADAKVNVPLAREIADFVNTATGRGSLGKLESSAVVLNSALFAPRLIASRLKMMNPQYYILANPFVRREALKSLFAVAAAGGTFLTLGKMAGGQVSLDPTNSDFMKLRVGDLRIDPFAGFQQYIVAASRLMSGTVTSSSTGREYDLWNPKGPFAPNHADIIGRFARGKLHPELGFALSILNNKTEMSGEKMNFSTMNPMENAMAQRFVPIVLQDMYEISKTQPEMLPIAGPASVFGMGVQAYTNARHSR
jgi:Histidine kinase-, DNA gyrase B-, and HSP90-like ATPase